MSVKINGWEVNALENKLFNSQDEILLQPLCMSLLLFLSERSGKVVERKEIIRHVWQGRVVSEDALNNSIRKIRKALGDNPKKPQLIQTINKKGYRLIAPVTKSSEIKRTGKKSRRKRMLNAIFSIAAITAVFSLLPVDIEVINISPEMTEQEKQKQYDLVKSKTRNGGHIVKLSK